MPGDLAESAVRAARSLPGSAGHYVYPPGDLHLTVANLDSAVLRGAELLRACQQVAAATPPFQVRMHGLGMTAHSVYAQVWDQTGSLWRLRRELAAATGGPLSLPRRLLGFVNLVRFLGPDVRGMHDAVRHLRHLELGSLDVDAIEIVRTDKVLATDATTVLGRLALARP